MTANFVQNRIVIKDIPKDLGNELFLLENNETQINDIYDFFESKNSLLLINGFKGTGKSYVVDYISKTLNPDVVILKYNCLETTILDDMLLCFFDEFRNYAVAGKIVPPRIKTENFTQKINSYFNTIQNPIVIILNSFEQILKDNKPDILSFIKHLTKLPNIKIILTSRNFQPEDFTSSEQEIKAGNIADNNSNIQTGMSVNYSQVTFLALTKQIFEKFLKANGIKNIGAITNELYNYTKGYYGSVNLALKLMNLRQWSVVQFLEEFSKSFMTFNEFLNREEVLLIDPVSAHLFRLLTVMRIPIHINLIKSLHLYDESKIYFYLSNLILLADGESLYLQESVREIIEHQIPDNVMIKLHRACIDLYNTQLPLKPLERDLRLSRQTMRNEIEYHSLFIPKKPVFDYSDVRVLSPAENAENVVVENVSTPPEKNEAETIESKEEKIKKINFIIEDEMLLDGIAESINDFISDQTENNQIRQQSENLSLNAIMNMANKQEAAYNWKSLITLYQTALTKKDDENFYRFLPTIYSKLANAYENLSQWYEALENYTQAQDFYENTSNYFKVWETKLKIANIYYIIYKHDNAKFILTNLEKNPDLPAQIRIKVNMALAKLTDDIDEEYNYYKSSIDLLDANTDKSVAAELYYHFAVVNDEHNNTRTAVMYYKKCIEDFNPQRNKYLSMALSNLAELYAEAGSVAYAVKYFNDSIEIDKKNNNYNGLYISYVHLAHLYSTQDDKALECLNSALTYAKKLNESFYIAEAYILIGDYYLRKKDIEQAYNNYIQASDIAQHSLSKENIEKINSRIGDIKKQLTDIEFQNLQVKYAR